jgi:hypothetical protein
VNGDLSVVVFGVCISAAGSVANCGVTVHSSFVLCTGKSSPEVSRSVVVPWVVDGFDVDVTGSVVDFTVVVSTVVEVDIGAFAVDAEDVDDAVVVTFFGSS